MENIEQEHTHAPRAQQPQKRVPFKKGAILKKLDQESARTFSQIKDRINKKSFGRKIRDWEILSVAIKLITSEHIKELQEQTLSEKDRLHLSHQEYVDKNGKITLDQFIGKLIRGEISKI